MAIAQISAAALNALAASPPTDPAARKALHDAARNLVFACEGLSDTESRVQGSITILPIVKVATDLDLFNVIASRDGGESWHVDDLAKKVGVADPKLLHRILRFLATQGLVAETGAGTYGSSRLTAHVQPSGFKGGVGHNSRIAAPSLAAFPAWCKKTGYRTPAGSKDCAFQRALGTDLDAFGLIGSMPEAAADTMEYMAWQKVRVGGWMDGSVGVVEEFQLTEQEVKDGRALLVDVGGGGGHQCFDFRKAFPERKGRLVVQDTEIMIGMIDKSLAKSAGVEPMAHDFFTPQPESTNGAKVYYMRTVLHDWNDEQSIVILKQLSSAMADDSMVVLDEIVVPEKGASEKQMLYDMVMLTALGSGERSESQWRALLEAAGLKLRDVSIFDEEVGTGLVIAVKA